MRLAVATLADAATVRDNLLNVLGAGLYKLSASELPARFEAVVAILAELELTDVRLGAEFRLVVRVTPIDSEEDLLRAEGTLAPTDENEAKRQSFSDEASYVPIVIPLRTVEFAAEGRYQIVVSAGSDEQRIPFSVSLSSTS
ncbi:hypothetical protein GCM10009737_10890 [Nocardioides lentus]|uniref:Uncharacterized protein n=1 Tax=Nocardioides lentus TaxID=338077 RepID=A0ABN2P386_9ACTN